MKIFQPLHNIIRVCPLGDNEGRFCKNHNTILLSKKRAPTEKVTVRMLIEEFFQWRLKHIGFN